MVHTANPLTGERGQLFGEAVAGMGEALVGNFPGRALSFTAPAAAGGRGRGCMRMRATKQGFTTRALVAHALCHEVVGVVQRR